MVNNMIKKIIYKVLLVSIIVLFGTLIVNKSSSIKELVYDKVYVNYLNFSSIKNIYNMYLGDIIPFQDIIKEQPVFNEKIKYNELSTYNNGVKLTLNNNIVPILDSGIVIFIGNKDNFNKTVIIENSDGVEEWYGNLDNIKVNLYDYVNKNDILGDTNNNTLYLEFMKDNKPLDYNKFL
jgi:stage IV sporulation protein FA